MKIALLSEMGGITCHNEECLFKKECANHATAGDHRSEGGFSPKLRLVTPEVPPDPDGPKMQLEVHCDTIEANPLYEQYRTIPINHDDLDRGEVYVDQKTGKFKSYDPFRDRDFYERYDYKDYDTYLDEEARRTDYYR